MTNVIAKVINEIEEAMDEDDDLTTCPFDGGVGEAVKLRGSRFPYYCRCSKCKVRTPSYVSLALATAHWNRRVQRS